ncbi:glycosyltransferase family 4 protein [archaeon]|nr:glycosyltransferase family 4 protein [archaeon]
MKIAFVSMFYEPTFGGVEMVIKELAEHYAREHEVHVYCCDSDKYKRIRNKYEIINGVHVHRHRYWFRLSLSTFIWPGLFLTLPFKRFDIIHSHVSGHAYNLFAGIIAKLKGIKYIHTTHCPWTDKYRPFAVKIPLFLNEILFNKIAFALADRIIAITPWEIPILRKWARQSKIKVIPNGMPELFFKKIKQNSFREELKIPKTARLILFFGRLNITKGPDKFVLAAKEILKERNNVWFIIRGPDEGMKEKVKELIGNEKKIILMEGTKDKEQVIRMYQASDLYCLPSYREGLPLTLFEAMASGLPIVASPVNGVPYEMKELDNGLFVDYGDINGLKKAILKILNDKNLAKNMRTANMEKAKHYKWKDIAERYRLEYEAVK